MSASGKLFQDERERHLIEVPDSYYKEHFEFFKYPKTKHIRTIVTADEDMFKDDERHNVLLKQYMKANKDLRDYKFDKRHNHKK
jgi:hypothetical protein